MAVWAIDPSPPQGSTGAISSAQVSRVNSNIRVREHAINQFEVVAELEHKKNTLKQLGQAADQTEISVRLAVIIEEVLASMGRGKDFNAMKETLEANIITTTDDIMVLTQNYCESISIPWGFVVACKQKVRASRAQNDDSWTFPNKDEQPVESLVERFDIEPYSDFSAK